MGKGENVFNHINDFDGLLDSGDEIINACSSLEKRFIKNNILVLLTRKITAAFNVAFTVNNSIHLAKFFPHLFAVYDVAEKSLYTSDCIFASINHSLSI